MAPKMTSSVDAGDGQDGRVDEGGDQHVVARLDDLDEVVPEVDVRCGQENSRRDASRRSFIAIRTMKMNGTTKMKTETTIAAPPTQYAPRRVHSSTCLRLRNHESGTMIDRDDDEEDDVAGGRKPVEAGLVLLVDHRGDDVGGEARAAPGHRPDEVEGAQAADQREDDHRHRRRPHQRQRDVPEVLPAGGAVDGRGLVVVARDRGDAGHVDDGREPDALPHIDERDREQRELRIGEPARALDAEERRGSR